MHDDTDGPTLAMAVAAVEQAGDDLATAAYRHGASPFNSDAVLAYDRAQRTFDLTVDTLHRIIREQVQA